jgi:prepilin-type processing-associated H-X9-DG protein
MLVVTGLVGLLTALLLPAVQASREAVRRSGCANHLRQIGLALTAYHDTQRVLPPAVADNYSASSQLHAWTVYILPYLEERALYQRYNFAAGYNSVVNQPIVETPLSVYSCPSDDGAFYEGNGVFAPGNYAAASGIEPAVNGGTMFPASRVRFKQITDGLSKTFLAGELHYHNLGWARGSAAGTTGGGGGNGAAFSRGVSRWWSCNSPCAQPGLNPPTTECNNHCERRFQFSSPHAKGVNFVFADGHVEFLADSIDRELLRSLTTIAGAEANRITRN